jgi:fructose-bisphosphate aldolase class II
VSLTSTRRLVAQASADGGAVAAFNVITLDHAESIVAGASRAGTGALLQLSENAIRFHGSPWPILAACRELADAASVPIGIHLDHLEDVGLVRGLLARAGEFGIGSLMFDASRLDYGENVRATRGIAEEAQAAGLWVEAELGAIGGKEGAHAPGVRTNPDEARSFVEQTGVDGLAVAVGSSHAMLERSAVIDVALVGRLATSVSVPLVLHGSSGIADDMIRQAVEAGIRKVNVGTALNIASTAALRASLAAAPDVIDPRKFSRGARDATVALVAQLCRVISFARLGA